ncbi:hypothetical protein D3C84_1058970 [compost metagenome]
MDVAFIQHTQHQIDRQQRAKDHPRLALLHRGERIGGAGHFRDHLFGQTEFGNRPFDGGGALLHGHAFGHVKRQAFGGKLAFVADPIVFQAGFVVGDGR